eukprot:m.137441 g.137441  ORF g.137441 m.137441 type:complete len:77 (+) comp13973_c0_seq2:5001-5231(+)
MAPHYTGSTIGSFLVWTCTLKKGLENGTHHSVAMGTVLVPTNPEGPAIVTNPNENTLVAKQCVQCVQFPQLCAVTC